MKLRILIPTLLLLLPACGELDTASDTSSAAMSDLQTSFAPDEGAQIRARESGPVMGVTQRSTAADGTVVFHAQTSLLPEDTNVFEDIYLRDGASLVLVTKAPNGAPANNSSLSPCVSSDGQKVAFCSRASNLVSGDTNNDWDVFLYDRISGLISRVSVGPGVVQGTHRSVLPSISSDGSKVAFLSRSRFGTQKANNTYEDVFLRDLSENSTTLISRNGGIPANFHSYDPVVSGDGTKVAYASRATNLVAGDTNARQDIFLCDATSPGVNTNLTPVGNSHSYWPSLSFDGASVAFSSYANNLVAGDSGAFRDIFVWNGTTMTRIGGGNKDAQQAAISGDGHLVAFATGADGLLPGDSNGKVDVFVIDAAGAGIARASAPTSSEDLPGDSDLPGFSWGDAYVTFRTQGGNFHPLLTNSYDKIIRRAVSEGQPSTISLPSSVFPQAIFGDSPGNARWDQAIFE
jgi:Tol biopolymer transport system component